MYLACLGAAADQEIFIRCAISYQEIKKYLSGVQFPIRRSRNIYQVCNFLSGDQEIFIRCAISYQEIKKYLSGVQFPIRSRNMYQVCNFLSDTTSPLPSLVYTCAAANQTFSPLGIEERFTWVTAVGARN
jgi:hypothetical protein